MVAAVAENVKAKTLLCCGHFIPEEQPEEFVRLLASFLKEAV